MAGEPRYSAPEGAWTAQYVRSRFGRETTILENNPTLSTAQATILKGNPRRLFWAIFNLGSSDAFGGFSTLVSTSNGWRVQQGGGYASAAVDEDGELVTQAVFMLSQSATPQLYTVEVMGV